MAKRKMLPQTMYTMKSGEVTVKLDLSRFEKQFQKAQFELDSAVMTSMIPYMPMQDGLFIDVTMAQSAALAGSGEVCAAAAPSGRFLYEGEAMVGIESRSAWAKKGEKKVTTGKKLDYSKKPHPKVQSHWFKAAKKADGEKWIARAKKTAGGG